MKFDTLSEPLETRLAEGLARLAAVARQLDWQTAEAAGLTPTQADILRFSSRRPDGVRLTAAADHAGITKATASDAVGALERKALLRKGPDPDDGRAVALKVTPKGARAAASWPEGFGQVVHALGAPEQEKLFGLVVEMIRVLQLRGLISPLRTCVSCRYFQKNSTKDPSAPYYCSLVEAPMAERHLRVDCPEHQAA